MKKISKYALYLFPLVFWAIVYFGFSFDGLYGQDAYEYLRYSESLKAFLVSGKPPGDYFWGIYYPAFGSVISFVIPNIALALQLVSIISLSIATIYTYKFIRLVYPEKQAGWLPFLCFTLSPIVLIHSVLVMSDMLGCSFTIAAIYFLSSFTKTIKPIQLLTGAALAALAILTRYAAILLLIPFGIMALAVILKNRRYSLLIYSVVVMLLMAIPHLWIRSQHSLQFLSHQWLQSWRLGNLFKADFTTVDGLSQNHFINLVYAFFSFYHPIFMFFGILILVWMAWKRNFYFNNPQKLILISILVYAVFLAGIPFQNKRFLLLSFPLVVTLLFPAIHQLTSSIKQKRIVLGMIALVQVLLTAYFLKPFYDRNLLEKEIASAVTPYQNQTLYSFDIDIALKGRKLHFDYKNLFLQRYVDFEQNALVLVNETQINKQWQGKNPGINLSELKQKYSLVIVEGFAEGWMLYKISLPKKQKYGLD